MRQRRWHASRAARRWRRRREIRTWEDIFRRAGTGRTTRRSHEPRRLKPFPAPLCLSSRGFQRTPPRDALLAGGVGEPQQEIAMARARRAEAYEIKPPQFIERPKQVVLVDQPPLVLHDEGCPIAVLADPERIAPSAATTDVDGAGRNARLMLVENLAHRFAS